jgi:hypothetical protein
LEAIEQLVGSRAGLASLQIDDGHGRSVSLADRPDRRERAEPEL